MYDYDRRIAGVKAQWITGGGRAEILDPIWDMYESSYMSIGMHIPSPGGLMKYDKWEVFFDGDTPVAFNLYKTTKFGLKTGLIGSDGTSQGKGAIKAHLRSRYMKSGIYGEVSHAVERITQGVPVVCAVHAAMVLMKPVVPKPDGIHYDRQITGLGTVTKKLIGNPKGVESHVESWCPIPEHPGERVSPGEVVLASEDDGWMDMADHAACQYA